MTSVFVQGFRECNTFDSRWWRWVIDDYYWRMILLSIWQVNKTISQGFIISDSWGCFWMIHGGSNMAHKCLIMVHEGALVVQEGSILVHEGSMVDHES